MAERYVSGRELLRLAGVPDSTGRAWLRQYAAYLHPRADSHPPRYPAADAAVLRQIAAWRREGLGPAAIRRRLGAAAPLVVGDPPPPVAPAVPPAAVVLARELRLLREEVALLRARLEERRRPWWRRLWERLRGHQGEHRAAAEDPSEQEPRAVG